MAARQVIPSLFIPAATAENSWSKAEEQGVVSVTLSGVYAPVSERLGTSAGPFQTSCCGGAAINPDACIHESQISKPFLDLPLSHVAKNELYDTLPAQARWPHDLVSARASPRH
jgi:hypothetical protein